MYTVTPSALVSYIAFTGWIICLCPFLSNYNCYVLGGMKQAGDSQDETVYHCLQIPTNQLTPVSFKPLI